MHGTLKRTAAADADAPPPSCPETAAPGQACLENANREGWGHQSSIKVDGVEVQVYESDRKAFFAQMKDGTTPASFLELRTSVFWFGVLFGR